MKKYLLFSLLFLLSSVVNGKEVKLFKNFGADNPMSYQFVRTIAQDSNDFMWFGSHEGLHRFDGYQFLSFHHDNLLPNSLSSDVISRILIDKQQQLWIGTSGGGLNLYREITQDFYHITSETKDVSLTNDVINVLFEDHTGNLWIGTENGLNILSRQENTWSVKHIYQELGNQNSLSHNTVTAIVEIDNQQIWVGTNGGGISVFDLNGNFIKTVKYGDNNTSVYANKFINSLFLDVQGNLWIGTVDQGLLKYNLKVKNFSHYQFNESDNTSVISNTIKMICQDSDNRLWIATDKGLLIYNEKENNFSRFNHSPNNPFSLSNDFILSFFEDKNHLMWIGTFTGVNRWDPNMTTFNQYSSQTNPELLNGNVTSFTQFDAQRIFFSTYSGGIYQLSLSNSEISRIDFNNYFAELRIMTLFGDGNTLWIGTRASGLFKVDLYTKKIVAFQHNDNDETSISANSITDIIKDRNGQIWVSTFHQAINRLNNDGTFSHFIKNDTHLDQGPSTNQVLQLLEDDQGYIWLATYGGGLNRFNPRSEKFIHLRHDEQNPNSLSSDLAWILLQDRDKNLWVGTQAAGFNILDHKKMLNNDFTFRHLDTKDGMKSRTVYGITQDIYGDIWFSSNKGISRFSSKLKNFKHFDLSHGLVDLEYNHGSLFLGLDNTIYFGAGKGFISVKPDTINSNLPAPMVRLTNVFKLNAPMHFEQNIADLNELTFEYSDQLISFEYVGLNYANPESTRYKYRLLGFDQEWIDAGKLRRATYTNLPAGKYELQVIAGNSDDIWSDPGLALAIIVKPAPWNTWWAYLIYTVIAALLLLTYSRFLNRKLLIEQKQKLYLAQQVQEKTKDFQEKNTELEHANKQLENAATIDKLTGVKSRRYLDIYIEQASQLMAQIHRNILPVQRSILPRLYLMMVKIDHQNTVNNSQLMDLTDLLLYSRNSDDLVIRWSEDTFAIIGYEKDDNAREMAIRVMNRFGQTFNNDAQLNMAFSFYPFNTEQPMELSWDQVSVITENALNMVANDNKLNWLGLYQPRVQPFNYLAILAMNNLQQLSTQVKVKHG